MGFPFHGTKKCDFVLVLISSVDCFLDVGQQRQFKTSGQSNLKWNRITAAHGRFSRIRQVAPMSTPSHTCFLVPAGVHIPNGISIGSADFAGLTIVTGRETNHATLLARIGHVYVVLRCGLNIIWSVRILELPVFNVPLSWCRSGAGRVLQRRSKLRCQIYR